MESSNWKAFKLGKVTTKIGSGSTPTGGSNAYKDEGISLIRSQNVLDFTFSNDGLAFIDDEQAFRLRGVTVEENDILFNITGDSVARVCKVPSQILPARVNQHVAILRADNINLHYDFLLYLMQSKKEELLIMSEIGATRNAITKVMLENLEIQLPPLPEQKAIASVLSSLDDKIDLLHQQNQTLEALAETLYLNFIGEREFNSKLSDIFSLQNGYAFKSKSFKESGIIRVIKIKNISGDIVDITNSDFVDDESIKKLDVKFKIDSGDILIAMTGAEVGKLGIVPETDQSLWLNQRVGSIKQKFEGAKYLAYLHLKSDFGQDYIENTATGSAQPNISGEGIENCEFPLYEEAELEEICNKLSPLYDKVIFNLGQIQTLTKLRDTLLPKLMSGEVRVKN